MNKKIFIILIPVLVCCAFFNSSYASSNTTISIPTISIKDASDIKNNQATLNARIDSINNLEYIEWWFEYGVLENNLFSKTDVTKETLAKDISYTLSNLSPDSLYF